MEHLNKENIEIRSIVTCKEVVIISEVNLCYDKPDGIHFTDFVPISEGPLSEILLCYYCYFISKGHSNLTYAHHYLL